MISWNSLWRAYREKPYRNIFVALSLVILFDALAPNDYARGRFADLMLVAIFAAALFETVRTRRNRVAAMILGLPAIVLRVVVAFVDDSPSINALTLAVNGLFLGFLIWNLLHDLATDARSTGERVFGALCAYVFIGLFFALIYTHMEYRHPGSFTGVGGDPSSPEANLYPAFTYYSFVTLTTLGYGDITPVAEHARTLAWFEALLGQLYLAVMVAGFVAVHISENMKESRGDPPSRGSG
jgi:hypothetical protein